MKILYLTLILTVIFGCKDTTIQEVDVNKLKNTYNFKMPSKTALSKDLTDELFIPFYKDGKYYLSDYDGKIVTKQGWDKIKLLPFDKLFCGFKDSKWRIYRYPEEIAIDKEFSKDEFLVSVNHIVTKNANDILRGIKVRKEIDLGSIDNNATKRKKKFVEEEFYISNSSKLPIRKSYYNPYTGDLSKVQKFNESNFFRPVEKPYTIAVNNDFLYCVIDIHGKEIFQGFNDIKKISNEYVGLVNVDGKMALANLKTRAIFDFNFDDISFHCEGAFLGEINQPDGNRKLFFLDKNGISKSIKSSSEINCPDKVKDQKFDKVTIKKANYFEQDKLYGVKDANGEIIIEPTLRKIPTINNVSEWISIAKKGKYGIMDFDGNWIFPLAPHKLYYYSTFGHYKHSYQLNLKGYTCIFNDKLELLHERPNLLLPIEEFEKVKGKGNVSISILKPPHNYEEYMVFTEKEFGHIYSSSGKYISSHKGKYIEDVAFVGLPRSEKFKNSYVPIGMFIHNGIDYYVRLTDGFEYNEYYSSK